MLYKNVLHISCLPDLYYVALTSRIIVKKKLSIQIKLVLLTNLQNYCFILILLILFLDVPEVVFRENFSGTLSSSLMLSQFAIILGVTGSILIVVSCIIR